MCDMAKITVTNEYFDVRATLTCGQLFRYAENADGSFTVYSLDKMCTLRECDRTVTLESDDIDYFKEYFDLDTDYGKICAALSAFPELKESVSYGKGIRILRQDIYETIFSFIISSNNNITRIKGIIERLCEKYGTFMGDRYAFPTLAQLKTATTDELRALGLGYRAEYIYESCREYESLPSLRDLPLAEASKALMSLKGVGQKVADCITLFGLHDASSYPVDTWIFKANATKELSTPQRVREHFSERYGKYAGYAQQYVFYYARTHK